MPHGRQSHMTSGVGGLSRRLSNCHYLSVFTVSNLLNIQQWAGLSVDFGTVGLAPGWRSRSKPCHSTTLSLKVEAQRLGPVGCACMKKCDLLGSSLPALRQHD